MSLVLALSVWSETICPCWLPWCSWLVFAKQPQQWAAPATTPPVRPTRRTPWRPSLVSPAWRSAGCTVGIMISASTSLTTTRKVQLNRFVFSSPPVRLLETVRTVCPRQDTVARSWGVRRHTQEFSRITSLQISLMLSQSRIAETFIADIHINYLYK